MVKEENGLSHKRKVLVSKDLDQDKLVIGPEYLNDIGILHKQFPKTLSEKLPARQGNTSIQATASGGRPMEEAFESRQGKQQLKEEPPDRQGNTSIQAVASGGRPVEEAIQSSQGWQQRKEELPDRQGNESIQTVASGAHQWRKLSRAGREARNRRISHQTASGRS